MPMGPLSCERTVRNDVPQQAIELLLGNAVAVARAADWAAASRLSFERTIHSRMIFRCVSWSSMFAVPRATKSVRLAAAAPCDLCLLPFFSGLYPWCREKNIYKIL